MGAQSHPTTQEPGAVDHFAGHPLFPIPVAPIGTRWGQPLPVSAIPLIATLQHAVFLLERRWYIARRDVGGWILHAGLTDRGWIQPNGARFEASPLLVLCALQLVIVQEFNRPDWSPFWYAATEDANAALRCLANAGAFHG